MIHDYLVLPITTYHYIPFRSRHAVYRLGLTFVDPMCNVCTIEDIHHTSPLNYMLLRQMAILNSPCKASQPHIASLYPSSGWRTSDQSKSLV